jgi:predicted nucleic acid-binding protein
MAIKPRIALDSCVLIDLLDPKSALHPDVLPVYQDALLGKLEILVSEISVAEVCKISTMISSGRMTPEEATKFVGDFFDNKFVLRRPVDRRESLLAADTIRNHNLETCDAIIVATAVIHNARILYTRDGKKRRKSQSSPLKCDAKLGNPPLPIKEPNAAVYLNQPLFDKKESDEN